VRLFQVCLQATSKEGGTNCANTRSQTAASRAPPEATNTMSPANHAPHAENDPAVPPAAPPDATNTTSTIYYAPIDCGLRVELLIVDKSMSMAHEDLYMFWHCEVCISLGITKVRDSLHTRFRDRCVSVS